MTSVTVRFFALGRELMGTSELVLSLPTPTTVQDVIRHITAQHPQLERLPSFVVAKNAEYAFETDVVENGDELAIIPPVSGG